MLCHLNISAGGDMAMICGQNGVSSCNGPCPCPWCICPKNKLSAVDEVFPERTRDNIGLLAHVVEGTCPGCGMEIVKQVEDEDTQRPLFVRGTKTEPVVPKHLQGQGVTHLKLHHGITPGTTVNYRLEPADWSMCNLHAGLCVCGGLFKLTLQAHLDKLVDPQAQESHGKQIWDVLLRNGAHMKISQLKKKNKKMVLYDLLFKSSSFTGKMHEIVYRLHPELIRIVFSDHNCGDWVPDDVLFGDDAAAIHTAQDIAIRGAKNSEAALSRFRIRKVWRQWGKTWQLLNKPMEYTEGKGRQEVWDERADEVQASTKKFVLLHLDAVNTTEGLYLHVLHSHAHQQVRKFGDLRVRQSQGLEHAHAARKRIGLNCTNRKQGQRLETMLTFKMVLAMLARLDGSDYHAHMHAKKKESLLRRSHAKIERTCGTYKPTAQGVGTARADAESKARETALAPPLSAMC